MPCHGCWLKTMDVSPCLQGCQDYRSILLPSVVLLDCYVAMVGQDWNHPSSIALMVSRLNDVPFTAFGSSESTHVENQTKMIRWLDRVSSDWDEQQAVKTKAFEIWPMRMPWTPGQPRERVLHLSRAIDVLHAPVALGGIDVRKRFEADLDIVLRHGQPTEVSRWEEWFGGTSS